MKRILITLSFLLVAIAAAWAQPRYNVVQMPLCWTVGSVDSSITRYVLVSSTGAYSTVLYLDAAGQEVIYTGGTLRNGHCDCCQGAGIDSTFVQNDSVFIASGGNTYFSGIASVFALNGLNMSGDTTKLGGPLTENTTITGGALNLVITGTNTAEVLRVNNTSGNGSALRATATGFGAALVGFNSSGNGILGQSNASDGVRGEGANNGVYGTGVNGGSFLGTTAGVVGNATGNNGIGGWFNYAANNQLFSPARAALISHQPPGTTSNGVGARIGFNAKAGTTIKDLGNIGMAFEEINAPERRRFFVDMGGITQFEILSDSIARLNRYSTGANVGTGWARAVFGADGTIYADSTGASGGSIGGSGTVNTVAKWTTPSTLGNSLLTDDGARITAGGTAGFVLPVGTTAQRSGAPLAGEMRKNITTNLPEIYTNSEWRDFQLANFQSSLVPYATSNGQLGADTFVYRSGEGMFFRRVSTSGENAAITVARVNNAFPSNLTNPLEIGYSGSDAYYIGNSTTNRITFMSAGRIQIGGPIQRSSGGNSMITSNGRPGHFYNELNEFTGTRIFKHIFGEANLGNTINNISPFIVTLPSRQTLTTLNHNNSIISGAVFRQTLTADSSTVSPITLQALDLNPSYQSNGYQANAYGLRYRPSSLSSVINHYAITTTSGKVGFGTETPSDDLHVVGTARVTGSSTLPSVTVAGRDSLGVFTELPITHRGSASDTTDGSGDLTINQAMPDATFVVTVAVTGTTPYIATVHDKSTSGFKIRFFDTTGAAVTTTAVTADWTATDN